MHPRVNCQFDRAVTGDDRWAALWASAHEAGRHAAAGCVPTPINIDGEWLRDGLQGGAFIVVRDARTGLARWLLREGHAHRNGPGATVVAWGFDQGKAYAEAFADVLALNGVDSRVTNFLT